MRRIVNDPLQAVRSQLGSGAASHRAKTPSGHGSEALNCDMASDRRSMTVRVVALRSPAAAQPPAPARSCDASSGPCAQIPSIAPEGHVHPDFRDIVAELIAVDARFLIVGAHALCVHGVPRALRASRG